ncbi:unnamed protein product, partial [marine sediment metagenome]
LRSSAGARALHLQAIDCALVSGDDFDLGVNCDLFGLRIDSSIGGSATMSGHFYGINIAKALSSKKDWQIGVDINDSTIGLKITDGTTAINIEGTVTLALGIGSTVALTTAESTTSAVKVQSNYSPVDGYHVGSFFSSQYTYDGAAVGSVYALRGNVGVTGTGTDTGTNSYIIGTQGRVLCTGGTMYNS